MRCYFIKDGRIASIEFLLQADDEGLVEQSKTLFESNGKPRGAEGFEVWDGARFIYRWPSER